MRHQALSVIGGLIVLLVLGDILQKLAGFAWLLALGATVVLVVWTFVGSGGVQAFVMSAPTAAAGKQGPVFGRARGKAIVPDAFVRQLVDGAPFGLSPAFAKEIADSLFAFQVSREPAQPWSLWLAAEDDWALQEFTSRFCAGLGLSLDQARVFECTEVIQFNPDDERKAIAAAPVPVLILNSAEYLRQHEKPSLVTAPLGLVLRGRDLRWNRTIIVALERVKAADMAAIADSLARDEEFRTAARTVTAIPIESVGKVRVLATLTEHERVVYLWEDFCRMAEGEYQVVIEGANTLESLPAANRLQDFLQAGLSTWNRRGGRAAREFVRISSQGALAAARVKGVRQARPYWHPIEQELRLQPTKVQA